MVFEYMYNHGNKNIGIPSIKILLNIARRNYYLDSHCILVVMIPEMMTRAIYCKKSFWISRNRSKCAFRLIGFPGFVINHESHHSYGCYFHGIIYLFKIFWGFLICVCLCVCISKPPFPCVLRCCDAKLHVCHQQKNCPRVANYLMFSMAKTRLNRIGESTEV